VVAEFVLQLLRGAGFGVTQAAEVTRLGLQTAIMLVTQFPGAETEAARDERDAIVAEKRRVLTALPSDRFPHLIEAADALTDCTDDKAYFGRGVDLYVEGVKALHRQRNRG
jgi:TetR/AcrR family transcriptional regulator, tetracycline repressor protein